MLLAIYSLDDDNPTMVTNAQKCPSPLGCFHIFAVHLPDGCILCRHPRSTRPCSLQVIDTEEDRTFDKIYARLMIQYAQG